MRSVVADLNDPISPDFAREWIGNTYSAGTADLPATEVLVAEVLKVPAHVWKETLGSLLIYDDTEKLARIAVPTRLIWGDADQLVTRETQDALLSAIPASRLSVYEGSGHAPRWDEPDRFPLEVNAFVIECASRP